MCSARRRQLRPAFCSCVAATINLNNNINSTISTTFQQYKIITLISTADNINIIVRGLI